MGLHGWPGIERLGLRVGGAGWRRTTAALILHLGTALDLACSSKVLARQGSRCAASRCVKLARRTLTPLTTTLPGGCPLHPSSLSAAHPASPAPSTLSLPGRLATGFAHTMPSPPPPTHTPSLAAGCSHHAHHERVQQLPLQHRRPDGGCQLSEAGSLQDAMHTTLGWLGPAAQAQHNPGSVRTAFVRSSSHAQPCCMQAKAEALRLPASPPLLLTCTPSSNLM
jgi:hypothetical protein